MRNERKCSYVANGTRYLRLYGYKLFHSRFIGEVFENVLFVFFKRKKRVVSGGGLKKKKKKF